MPPNTLNTIVYYSRHTAGDGILTIKSSVSGLGKNNHLLKEIGKGYTFKYFYLGDCQIESQTIFDKIITGNIDL